MSPLYYVLIFCPNNFAPQIKSVLRIKKIRTIAAILAVKKQIGQSTTQRGRLIMAGFTMLHIFLFSRLVKYFKKKDLLLQQS